MIAGAARRVQRVARILERLLRRRIDVIDLGVPLIVLRHVAHERTASVTRRRLPLESHLDPNRSTAAQRDCTEPHRRSNHRQSQEDRR